MPLFVPVQTTLRDHAKTIRLMDELDCPMAYAVGLVVALWMWAQAQQLPEDGTLPTMGPKGWELATGCDPKHRAKIRDALTVSGFLDNTEEGVWRIHNWQDHGGQYARRLREDRDRKARGKPADGSRNSSGIPAESDRNSEAVPGNSAPRREENRREEREKSARAREEHTPCQSDAPVGLESDSDTDEQAEEFLADLPIWENRGPTTFVRTLFSRKLSEAERSALLAWKPILAEAVRLGDPDRVRFLPALRTMLNPSPDAENGRWWESMDRAALRKRLNPDGVSPARQASVPAAATPQGLPEWAKWWDGLNEQERRSVFAGHLEIPTVCKRVDAAVVKSGAMLASGGELRYGDGLAVADIYGARGSDTGSAA